MKRKITRARTNKTRYSDNFILEMRVFNLDLKKAPNYKR